MCTDLYAAPPALAKPLAAGLLPDGYGGPHHKRLWMLVMLLRRDNSAVRCLFIRALSQHRSRRLNGRKALEAGTTRPISTPWSASSRRLPRGGLVGLDVHPHRQTRVEKDNALQHRQAGAPLGASSGAIAVDLRCVALLLE